MNNPFETIEARLNTIETLLLELKHEPKTVTTSAQLEELLTAKQTAQLLDLSLATIYEKVSRNELPYMKRGNRLYFYKSELNEYLKEGRSMSREEIEAQAEAYLSNNKKGLNHGR